MGCVYSDLKSPHCECMCMNTDSITAVNDNANANEERPSYLKVLDGAIGNKLTDGITKSASSCNPYEVDRSHFSDSIQLLGIGKNLVIFATTISNFYSSVMIRWIRYRARM